MRTMVVTGCPRAAAARAAFAGGELSLDRYGLRAVLARAGVEYVDHQEYQAAREEP